MFYLAQVLIGRSVVSLDRPFTYYTDDETIKAGHRVLVSFGPSKSTTGFILKDLEKIDLSLEEYQAMNEYIDSISIDTGVNFWDLLP